MLRETPRSRQQRYRPLFLAKLVHRYLHRCLHDPLCVQAKGYAEGAGDSLAGGLKKNVAKVTGNDQKEAEGSHATLVYLLLTQLGFPIDTSESSGIKSHTGII